MQQSLRYDLKELRKQLNALKLKNDADIAVLNARMDADPTAPVGK